MPRNHPLARKPVTEPADFYGADDIALSSEVRSRRRLDAEIEKAGARPRLVVETVYPTAVCALVLERVLIGIVNPQSVDGFA